MRLTVSLVAGLFLAACATTDTPPIIDDSPAHTATALIAHAQAKNSAYAILESLTTEVGPRLAGTEAEARARDWAVKKFSALGFDQVRVEPFGLPVWVRGEEQAEITAPYPQPLTITALGGSASTGPGGVEGEVTAFASLAALSKAPAGSLAGKIVFVDEVMARSADGSGYSTAVVKRRQVAYEAQRLGASAALIRSVGTSSHRFAHTGQMRRLGEDGDEGVPAAALSAPDADQLRRILERGQKVRLRLLITPRLLPAASSANVIAEIPGRESPGEIVLIAAHLDSWDLGTGAVDDGAGVAVVMASAALLLEHLPQAPRRTIRIVLFGAEEVGLLGAREYARRHAGELSRIVVATESDFGAGNIWRFDTGVPEHRLAEAQAVGKLLQPLGIGPGHNKASGGPDISVLHKAGVPVVGLLQDGWDYFNLHHTADDTMDKVAPGDLDQNVAAYAALMYLAAEMEVDFR